MRKRIVALAMIAAILLITLTLSLIARVHAATDWTVTLTAHLGTYKCTTTLGVALDATDGFDEAYDNFAPPPPPQTGVDSYFWYPDNTPPPPIDYRKLSTSIIPESPNMNWNLSLRAIGLSGTMVLNWTTIPPQYNAYVMDSTGTTILADMTQVSEYSYPAGMDVTITFTLSFVIPEWPIGPVLAMAVCFVSYRVFKIYRRD